MPILKKDNWFISIKQYVNMIQLSGSSTVRDLKEYIAREKRKFADTNRQELRLEPKGKALKDDTTLKELDIQNGAMIYFKVKIVISCKC